MARLKSRTIALVGVSLLLLMGLPALAGAIESIGGTDITKLSAEVADSKPDVSMAAGILVAPDGRELWSENPDERRAMASTTKIMTAVVVLEEEPDLEAKVTVPADAVAVGESVADLRAGDVVTVRQLLEAMLVKSGNDAAETLADFVGGDEAGFVKLMNEKAVELGLEDTHYDNPHGLDAADHYTSARDLSVLAQYAMGKAEFRRVVGLESLTIDSARGERVLETSNELLGHYDGATGVKTGWTSKAGYCLVATAMRDDIELTAVVLGTKSEKARFAQAEALLDWGFEHYRMQQLTSAEETVGSVPVADYLDVDVAARIGESTGTAVFDLDGPIERAVKLEATVDAPVAVGDRLGTLTLRQGEMLIAQVPLVAGQSVERPGFFERIQIAIVRAWRSIF